MFKKQTNFLKVDKNVLNEFRNITKKFLKNTEIPKKGNWKKLDNDYIWKKMFAQVIVVGNASSFDKFVENSELQKQISYEKLLKYNRTDREKVIHKTLLDVGTRYVSKDVRKCKKTKALLGIFEVLSNTSPRAILEEVSQKKSEIEKIEYFMRKFKGMYIGGPKSARDLLVDLGIIENAIALDVRVQRILRQVGALPKNININKKNYPKIQEEIIEKICKPLKLTGAQLDRMLYQNYDDILEGLGKNLVRKN